VKKRTLHYINSIDRQFRQHFYSNPFNNFCKKKAHREKQVTIKNVGIPLKVVVITPYKKIICLYVCHKKKLKSHPKKV